MPHDDHPTDHELARYFAGELSPAELERVEAWIGAEGPRRVEIEVLRDAWTRTADQPSDDRLEEVWTALSSKLGIAVGAPVGASARAQASQHRVLSLAAHRPVAQRWRAPAIALGGIAAAASIALFVVGPAFDKPGTKAPVAPTYREYTTKNAQRAEIRLSDGSRVVLAPASRLLVPESYGAKERALRLEGEAYFDVLHDEARPFSVRTAKTLTRDIGTAFAVTDYPDERAARVLVAEGEVAVLSARDSTAATLQLLKPGDLARVTAAGTVTRSRVANVQGRLAWLRGGLAFDGVPLGDALREIGRWYDLEIRVADPSLAGRHLVATIGNEPVDDVLNLVAVTLNLRVERAGRAVTFYSK